MSRRTGTIGRTLGLLFITAAVAMTTGCGGAGDRRASEPTESSADDQSLGAELDAECCCQRYDEDGNATGANVSDQTACKSTGGTCTQDETQCENE